MVNVIWNVSLAQILISAQAVIHSSRSSVTAGLIDYAFMNSLVDTIHSPSVSLCAGLWDYSDDENWNHLRGGSVHTPLLPSSTLTSSSCHTPLPVSDAAAAAAAIIRRGTSYAAGPYAHSFSWDASLAVGSMRTVAGATRTEDVDHE
jgi:hypothetical protein